MDTKTQVMLSALADQRNQAMDALVRAAAEIADRDAQIAELSARVKGAVDPVPTAS